MKSFFQSVARAFADLGLAARIILTILCMLPLYALTSLPDETLGAWHIRVFGITLRERFQPPSLPEN